MKGEQWQTFRKEHYRAIQETIVAESSIASLISYAWDEARMELAEKIVAHFDEAKKLGKEVFLSKEDFVELFKTVK